MLFASQFEVSRDPASLLAGAQVLWVGGWLEMAGEGGDELKACNFVMNDYVWLRPARDNLYNTFSEEYVPHCRYGVFHKDFWCE